MNQKIPVLTAEQAVEEIRRQTASQKNPFWPTYYAFFSSWYGAIVKDPGATLLVPLDDHMVHRGDAVFEALKSVNGKIFLLDEHLIRLEKSAEKIGLRSPYSKSGMGEIIKETLKVSEQKNTLIRVFLSRGPGSFTTNPYDPPQSQFFVVITELKTPAAEKYEKGVKIGRSQIPVKESWMAQVKSCNYLPNVMMKKESVDRKLDFTVSFDREGYLAESSTENIVIVDSKGILVRPLLENILKGTTMMKAFELAAKAGIATQERQISEAEILRAQEIMMMGTTMDVLPVTAYESKVIGDGLAGPIARKLQQLLAAEMN